MKIYTISEQGTLIQVYGSNSQWMIELSSLEKFLRSLLEVLNSNKAGLQLQKHKPSLQQISHMYPLNCWPQAFNLEEEVDA